MPPCPRCTRDNPDGTAFCPSCGLPLTAEVQGPPQETHPIAADQVGVACPYCRFPFEAGDSATACPVCRANHHADCWFDNGGCAVALCAGGPRVSGRQVAVQIPDTPRRSGSGPLVVDLDLGPAEREQAESDERPSGIHPLITPEAAEAARTGSHPAPFAETEPATAPPAGSAGAGEAPPTPRSGPSGSFAAAPQLQPFEFPAPARSRRPVGPIVLALLLIAVVAVAVVLLVL